MLGYFSLVGLLRLHSLLGDYYQAVKALENIEIHKKVRFISPVFHLTLRNGCEIIDFLSVSAESVFFSSSLPDNYGLLCRIRVHDDETVRGCHSYVQFSSVVFAESEAIVSGSHLSK